MTIHKYSDILHSKIFRNHSIIHLMLIAVLMAVTSACSSDDKLSFKDSQDALSSYSGFLKEVRHKEITTGEGVVELCRHWHQYRDSVVSAIDRDAKADNMKCLTACFATNDTIRTEMSKIIDSAPVTFLDYINIREACSDIKIRANEQELVDKYERYFASLDDNKIATVGKSVALKNYEALLKSQLHKGYICRTDLLDFIKEEDVYFRSFLTHLSSLGESSLAPIRENTEAVCRKIFAMPQDYISKEELVVIMTMRSNRRLIQNSDICLEDVKFNKIKDKGQASAYLWMLIQPLVALDDFSMALLTAQQHNSLEQLAKNLPATADKLKTIEPNIPIDINELPKLLTKAYILGNE